ncbi:MAG: TonB-dependent receptor [Candidatus Marinimicrobia bacterium]|nr:TonB-dependent receptor [Candidatus Neomarinimicrobiota bacterium]
MKKTPKYFWPIKPIVNFHRLLLNMKIVTILLFCGLVPPAYSLTAENHFGNDLMGSVADQQQMTITGTVTDAETGQPMVGVNIQVEGTTTGTITDENGRYSISFSQKNPTLIFSFIGYVNQLVDPAGRSVVDVVLTAALTGLDEVVVIGYGTQRRSDVTGTVASLPKDRLELTSNLNIAQAIQGSIPGVMIQTSSAGARSTETIMIRGRNSILADNTPLLVVDGIPYGGQINDINPNDVLSIEVLKDASAAAIYGSRGSNGVILITTKGGEAGKTKISYDGKFSIQNFTNLPDIMDGEQFYKAKMERSPDGMTQSEQAVYDSGEWVDWLGLASRKGNSHQHNLSVSGGLKNTKYYISGSMLDVRGLIVNDDYKRLTGAVNVDTDVTDWLTIGTRTNLSYNDMSGVAPPMDDLYYTNPLATAYDEDGNLTITPVTDDPVRSNPLQTLLFKNIDKTYQVLSNNFLNIDFPFIQGLSYRLNTGIRMSFADEATYKGRDTRDGLDVGGEADTDRTNFSNIVVENIFSYSRVFAAHSIFATGVYSFEEGKSSSNTVTAQSFPNDFLAWYATAQAEVVVADYSYDKTNMISQMLRLNYAYDRRYLATLSVRRDGYSGFGALSKWGVFPSVALGWNINNEKFFHWEDLFNELKLRISYGLNGNQAVGAYETISRLSQENTVALGQSVAGYKPSKLGSDNLGWEASSTLNLGVDVKILNSRVAGSVNMYSTTTTDLLLNRTISPVHGITSITQNIGKTKNLGLELDITSRNIVKGDFRWNTYGNLAFVRNEIVSLYGELDDKGIEIDDVASSWFIGEPIRINYDYVFDGIWQLDEADEAAKYGTQPGYVRLKDVNGDEVISAEDRQIIGQQDPKLLWGLTNSVSYKNFTLDIFIHGVHGVTKENDLRADHVTAGFRGNTTYKDYWTPTNPTNDFHMNHDDARRMSGIIATYYEDASFVRIKDVSLSYNVPSNLTERFGIDRLRVYINGRNLFTFTDWGGLDPELPDQVTIPLQKEIVFGLQLGF